MKKIVAWTAIALSGAIAILAAMATIFSAAMALIAGDPRGWDIAAIYAPWACMAAAWLFIACTWKQL